MIVLERIVVVVLVDEQVASEEIVVMMVFEHGWLVGELSISSLMLECFLLGWAIVVWNKLKSSISTSRSFSRSSSSESPPPSEIDLTAFCPRAQFVWLSMT